MKHKLELEFECDGRYQTPAGRKLVRSLIEDRVWRIDGVRHNTVAARPSMQADHMVLISRAELDELRHKAEQYDFFIQPGQRTTP